MMRPLEQEVVDAFVRYDQIVKLNHDVERTERTSLGIVSEDTLAHHTARRLSAAEGIVAAAVTSRPVVTPPLGAPVSAGAHDAAFGPAIRALRDQAGITQARLAHLACVRGAGMTTAVVGNIERGERNVTYGESFALADALGTTPERLTAHIYDELTKEPR